MRLAPTLVAVALIALAATPGAAPTDGRAHGAHFVYFLVRVVPTPVPAGFPGDDAATFRIDVDLGRVVTVDVNGDATSMFFFRFARVGAAPSGPALPSSHQGAQLSEGNWTVLVDPFAGPNEAHVPGGARMNITATFDGYVGDVRGARAAFSISQREADACVLEACLP